MWSTRYSLLACVAHCGRTLERSLDSVIRVLGPVLAFSACILIALVTYSFFSVVMPHINGSGKRTLAVLIGLFLLLNIIWNYALCAWMGPGRVPKPLSDQVRED